MASKYLSDESPLVVSPTLATAIGLNEALVLQQLRYWIEINRKANKRDTHYHEDKWWTCGTYEYWQQKNFPFWSPSTVGRTFRHLEELGLIESLKRQRKKGDHKKWYAMTLEDADLDDRIDAIQQERAAKLDYIPDHTKMTQSGDSNVSNWHDQDHTNLAQSLLTETTSETKDSANATASAPPPPTPDEPIDNPAEDTSQNPRADKARWDAVFNLVKVRCFKLPEESKLPRRGTTAGSRLAKITDDLLTIYPDLTVEIFSQACNKRGERFIPHEPAKIAAMIGEYLKAYAPVVRTARPVDADADRDVDFHERMYREAQEAYDQLRSTNTSDNGNA